MPLRKVLGAGLAGGIALFTWGIVSWMVLPLHAASVRALPGEDRVVEALRDTGTEPGLYLVPGDPSKRGPRALVAYDPAGSPPNRMFRTMILALAASVLAATFSAFLLS